MPRHYTPGSRIAEDREVTLEEIGQGMNLTRERIRQLEASGLKKIRAALERRGFDANEWALYLADRNRRSM